MKSTKIFGSRKKKGDDGQKSSWVGFGVCDVNRKRNVRLKQKSEEHCIINTYKAGGDFALATRSADCWWARRHCCWWTSLLSEKNRIWHWKTILLIWLLFTAETIRNHRHPSFTNQHVMSAHTTFTFLSRSIPIERVHKINDFIASRRFARSK